MALKARAVRQASVPQEIPVPDITGGLDLRRTPTLMDPARARRPAESLDMFLPQFDADGRHAQTPDALRVVCRVDELLDRQALAERARAAIDRLPDAYRTPFVLRDLEELPTADVAQVLGIEPAAVRQRVHRARLMMRGYLSELAGVEP